MSIYNRLKIERFRSSKLLVKLRTTTYNIVQDVRLDVILTRTSLTTNPYGRSSNNKTTTAAVVGGEFPTITRADK